jgi:hypothetical protein
MRTDRPLSRLKYTKWFIGALSVLVILAPVMAAAAPGALRKSKILPVATRWYLLAPPFSFHAAGVSLQLQAPLDRWVARDSTETLEDCQEQRNNMMRMYRSADITSTSVQIKQMIYHYSVCVFSADPRLKTYRFNARQSADDALLGDYEAGDHGLAGPFLQGAGFSENTHSLGDTRRENGNMSVPTMLLGIVVIAITGSLCGWLLEPRRNELYVWTPACPNEVEALRGCYCIIGPISHRSGATPRKYHSIGPACL